MKYLLLIAVLFSTQTIAADLICNAGGQKAEFKIENDTLIDMNEHIIATETSTGVFESDDEYGKVQYFIHGTNIIMKFNSITKEYVCQ